ncbi:hypothetical protein V6C32_10975 [Desulforamulus ruminis]|uniref:hypothetical protein n=1 Tax=Desulforamulus ruminis TaxID=1564 RepID=UPI002FDB59E7
MDEQLLKELFEAVYCNAVFPHELIKNLKDHDYLQVKFDSYMDGLRAEIKFVDEGEQVTSYYYFDKKDFLQRIEIIEDESVTTIYDRMEEVVRILSERNQLQSLGKIKELMSA